MESELRRLDKAIRVVESVNGRRNPMKRSSTRASSRHRPRRRFSAAARARMAAAQRARRARERNGKRSASSATRKPKRVISQAARNRMAASRKLRGIEWLLLSVRDGLGKETVDERLRISRVSSQSRFPEERGTAFLRHREQEGRSCVSRNQRRQHRRRRLRKS